MVARPGPLFLMGDSAGGTISRTPPQPHPRRLHRHRPIDIINGTRDVLHPDALALGQRARENGWRITVHSFGGGFHVFPAAVFLPESRAALDLTERLLLDAPSSA